MCMSHENPNETSSEQEEFSAGIRNPTDGGGVWGVNDAVSECSKFHLKKLREREREWEWWMKVENHHFGNQKLRETKRMMIDECLRCVAFPLSWEFSVGWRLRCCFTLSLSVSPCLLYYARTINLFTIINYLYLFFNVSIKRL